MRHLVSLLDIEPGELRTILSIASQVKILLKRGHRPPWLSGMVLGMIFEKPSLRTRVSFEAGIAQMAGTGMFLGKDVGWPDRESSADFIRVLAEYVDWVVCRMSSHQAVVELASYNAVPVINGLTSCAHPCQALGDIMTLQEVCPSLAGKTLAFIGDGNNVAKSLALACAMVGLKFRLLGPQQYFIDDATIQQICQRYPGFDVCQTSQPKLVLPFADFVYTDVWTSMGQEAESQQRLEAFSPYQVNSGLLSSAASNCRVLHCLPAKRGQEITDDVIDSPNSVVVQQAGNRMHAQKGLLLWMTLQHGQLTTSALAEHGIQLGPEAVESDN